MNKLHVLQYMPCLQVVLKAGQVVVATGSHIKFLSSSAVPYWIQPKWELASPSQPESKL